LQAIGFGSPSANFTGTTKVWENLKNICVGNLILAAAGLIPGYWVSFLFIDSWGRKPIQLMGFIVLTVLFCVLGTTFHLLYTFFLLTRQWIRIGFGYDKLTATPAATKGFVFLYCLANFFQNFGPNTTTFVIPGEAFPTRYRSTAHGISAASGKLGAIVAQVGFARLKDIGGTNKFVKHMYVSHFLFPFSDSDHFVYYRYQPRAIRLLHVDGYLLDAPLTRDEAEITRRPVQRKSGRIHWGSRYSCSRR
jgi:PHS family inorganic phosphate transporter-like MFS transporter